MKGLEEGAVVHLTIFSHIACKVSWMNEWCVRALDAAVQLRHEMLGSLFVLVAIILVVNSN